MKTFITYMYMYKKPSSIVHDIYIYNYTAAVCSFVVVISSQGMIEFHILLFYSLTEQSMHVVYT